MAAFELTSNHSDMFVFSECFALACRRQSVISNAVTILSKAVEWCLLKAGTIHCWWRQANCGVRRTTGLIYCDMQRQMIMSGLHQVCSTERCSSSSWVWHAWPCCIMVCGMLSVCHVLCVLVTYWVICCRDILRSVLLRTVHSLSTLLQTQHLIW